MFTFIHTHISYTCGVRTTNPVTTVSFYFLHYRFTRFTSTVHSFSHSSLLYHSDCHLFFFFEILNLPRSTQSRFLIRLINQTAVHLNIHIHNPSSLFCHPTIKKIYHHHVTVTATATPALRSPCLCPACPVRTRFAPSSPPRPPSSSPSPPALSPLSLTVFISSPSVRCSSPPSVPSFSASLLLFFFFFFVVPPLSPPPP